jgi:N-methylhydantoinase B
LGLRRDYRFPDHEVSFTVLSDRDRWGPEGLEGGKAGEKARYILDPEGRNEALGSKVTIALEADTVFSYRTCGGGGYGTPTERDPQAVARDVREGKVSVERARSVYGVVIDGGELDHAATAALRGGMDNGV